MTLTAYRYGMRHPLDWGDDCERELKLQNALWNRLVAIERQHIADVDALAAEDPVVAELLRRLRALDDEIAELIRRSPSLKEKIAALKEERAKLWAELKAARKVALDARRDRLVELSTAKFEAVKAARQNSGLWWGNYNAICAAFDVAAATAAKTHATLRFRRWDGNGRLTNQIQGGISTEHLMAGEHAQVTLRPASEEPLPANASKRQQRRRRMLLTVTVYTRDRGAERRTVTWPLLLDRPLPPEGKIKQVVVVRRLDGRLYSWHAVITVDVPDAEAQASRNSLCAIDLGWRQVPDGLRVATIVDDAGTVDHVNLASDWLDRMAHVETLTGEIDSRSMLEHLQSLPRDGWPQDLRALIDGIDGRLKDLGPPLAKLLGAWLATDWLTEERESLRSWLRRRRERIFYRAALQRRLLLSRREIYRLVADKLARSYGIIAIEDFDIAALAMSRDVPPPVRAMRQWASPHELRNAVIAAARKHGAHIVKIRGATTATCHHCGHVNRPPDPEFLIWRCQGCQRIWDQDENACHNMLAAAAGHARGDVMIAPERKKSAGFRRSRMTRKGTARKEQDNPMSP